MRVRREMTIKNVSLLEVFPDLGDLLGRERLGFSELLAAVAHECLKAPLYRLFQLDVVAENRLALGTAVAHLVVAHLAHERLAFLRKADRPIKILKARSCDSPSLDDALCSKQQQRAFHVGDCTREQHEREHLLVRKAFYRHGHVRGFENAERHVANIRS